MTHWRSMIEKDHLGCWDLQGKERTVTIDQVESRKVYNQKAQGDRGRLIIVFKSTKNPKGSKPWICNATNAETIEGMYGGDIEKWAGKQITLYPTTTTVGRKTVACVRVKNTIPRGKTSEDSPSAPVDTEMRAAQDSAFEREPGQEG